MMTLNKAKEILKGCEVNVEFEAKHTISLAEALKKPLKKSDTKVSYITFSVWESGDEIKDGHFTLFLRYWTGLYSEMVLCRNGGFILDRTLYDEAEVKEACEKLLPEILEVYGQ